MHQHLGMRAGEESEGSGIGQREELNLDKALASPTGSPEAEMTLSYCPFLRQKGWKLSPYVCSWMQAVPRKVVCPWVRWMFWLRPVPGVGLSQESSPANTPSSWKNEDLGPERGIRVTPHSIHYMYQQTWMTMGGRYISESLKDSILRVVQDGSFITPPADHHDKELFIHSYLP